MTANRSQRIRGLDVTETEFAPTQPADYTLDRRCEGEKSARRVRGALDDALAPARGCLVVGPILGVLAWCVVALVWHLMARFV
jgi:hypothetical protein